MKSTEQRPDCSGYRNRIVLSLVPYTWQDGESWPRAFFLPLRICIPFRWNQGKGFPACKVFFPAGGIHACLKKKLFPLLNTPKEFLKHLENNVSSYFHKCFPTCLRYNGGSGHGRAGDDQGLCRHRRRRVRGQRQPGLPRGLGGALALPTAQHCSRLRGWTSSCYCCLEQVLSARRGYWYLLIFILKKKLIFAFKKNM